MLSHHSLLRHIKAESKPSQATIPLPQMSLEGTLALAVKSYRTIVDSRRFIPLAPESEFKKVFDAVLVGLLENLSEAVAISQDTETETSIHVDAKRINVVTDILKLLIILKHFISHPVYADEVLHEIFEKAAQSDMKIVSQTSEFDDHKAKKRFQTFIVNFYVLLCEDSSLEDNSKTFFKNLSIVRFQDLLLEAAPRASQEEMYHGISGYRHLLLQISDVSEIVAQVIKRLDSYYPEPETIEGISRKDFLLNNLGWKNSTVLQCSERLHKRILEACKLNNKTVAFRNVHYFWILLAECKFVAPDEFCATLFIFPSECESFLKMVEILGQCLAQVTKTFPVEQEQLLLLNEINKEMSDWVQKLVKAVGTNYIHFERDLNNRNYRSSNKILIKIVVSLTNVSEEVYNICSKDGQDGLVSPVGEIKSVADFIEKSKNLTKEPQREGEVDEDLSGDLGAAELLEAKEEGPVVHTIIDIKTGAPITHSDVDDLDASNKPKVPLWALIIAIIGTVAAGICIKLAYGTSSKH